jgi:hypothetical protein
MIANVIFIAQSGLIGANGADSNPEGRPVYRSLKTNVIILTANERPNCIRWSVIHLPIKMVLKFRKYLLLLKVNMILLCAINIINHSPTPYGRV